MGVLEDSVFIMTSVLATAVILGMGYFAITQLTNLDQFDTTTATIVKQNFSYLDALLMFGTILLFIGATLLAYFLPTHPAFFFTFFLTAFIAFILSPTYSNIYEKIATMPLVSSSFDTFPLAALIIGNLPIITFILSALIALVSYGKRYTNDAFRGM